MLGRILTSLHQDVLIQQKHLSCHLSPSIPNSDLPGEVVQNHWSIGTASPCPFNMEFIIVYNSISLLTLQNRVMSFLLSSNPVYLFLHFPIHNAITSQSHHHHLLSLQRLADWLAMEPPPHSEQFSGCQQNLINNKANQPISDPFCTQATWN